MTKKENEKIEIEKEILKSKIEMHKTSFDRYVNVIVRARSAFIDVCTGGAYFNDLFTKLLTDGVEQIETSNKPEKEISKIRSEWFFGDETPTHELSEQEKEILKLKNNLKYWENLENGAKHSLNNLGEEVKKTIIIDAIEQRELWSTQFNRNSKLYKQLENKKK